MDICRALLARRLQVATSLVLTMVVSDFAELYHDLDAPRTRTLTAILGNVTVIVNAVSICETACAQAHIVVGENE
jgi:hypothetical protein